MRKTTALISQYKAEEKIGETLCFENCKGGYFSTIAEYGLKIFGNTAQNSIPYPESPVEIRCVKAGTAVQIGTVQITTPCDLYKGDIWYPTTGKVERNTAEAILGTADSQIKMIGRYPSAYHNDYCVFNCERSLKITPDSNKNIWCNRLANRSQSGAAFNRDTGGIFVHYAADILYICIAYEDLGEGYGKDTDNATMVQAANNYFDRMYGEDKPFIIRYELSTPIIEQYEPQFLSVPNGTVSVVQEPIDLNANLSATHLVRR